jgi:hypothetical protein
MVHVMDCGGVSGQVLDVLTALAVLAIAALLLKMILDLAPPGG